MSRSFVLALSFLSITALVRAQDCRDATGEPIACPAPAVEAPVVGVPPEVAPPRDPDPTGSVTFDLSGESLDLRPLRFTPSEPDDVADLARETTVYGTAPYDVPAMSFGLAVAARPLPWLEVPSVRLSWGFGTPEATVATIDQAGRTVELGALAFLRMEVGAGFDVPIGDVVWLSARGHVALAGYFVAGRIVDEALGSLGRTWLAEDAWEAGWTAGVSLRIDRSVRWGVSYRHVHTGAESHVLSMTVTADVR